MMLIILNVDFLVISVPLLIIFYNSGFYKTYTILGEYLIVIS